MTKPVIGIIGGTGKMGQWMQHFLASRGLPVIISGRNTPLSTNDLIKKADIIIVSVPISEVAIVLKDLSRKVRKDQLLTDITSLKVIPLTAMEEAASGALGMHPLFGPGISSPVGQKIVFCKQKDNEYVTFLRNLFTKAGMQVINMTADEHDYQMAYIQALTHAVNLMLVKTFLEEERELSAKLVTPLFTLQSLVMGRVLDQDLDLMADIQIYNPYFPPVLHGLIAQGKTLIDILEKYDKKKFIDMFAREKKDAHTFSNFSKQQTNRILKLAEETPTAILEKIAIRRLPTKGTVAYLGPQGTYSHKAVELVFGKKFAKVPSDNIFDIFRKVHESDADFGVVPAENSIEGVVKGTLDYLIDFSLFVCGSLALPIHHQLLSKEKNLSDITTIVSHPQALAQCQKWIRDNLPKAIVVTASSTASGLQDPKKNTAYIASSDAAKTYRLNTLAKNIEDNKENATRFYIIAKQPFMLDGLSNKKTLLFVTVYNRVGILKDILTVLAKYNINLTKLESRPSHEKVWDYHFFIELEKTPDDKELLSALSELKAYCPVIRVLGQT